MIVIIIMNNINKIDDCFGTIRVDPLHQSLLQTQRSIRTPNS